jgi:hypothetical protein
MGAVILLMILAAASKPDWNTMSAGLQRYAVWMLPSLAWMIVEALPETPLLRRAVVATILVQAALVLPNSGEGNAFSLRWPARVIWNYNAAQYNPEFDIFMQHVSGVEAPRLPLGYVAPNGDVTKILTDFAGLTRLIDEYSYVDPQWLRRVQMENRGRTGLFYVHPPRGAVKQKEPLPKISRLDTRL